MAVEKKLLPADLMDALLAGYKKPEDLIGQDGLFNSSRRPWWSGCCKPK